MERDAKKQVTAAAVWEHYIRGWRAEEIASELGISTAIVQKHIKEAGEQAKANRASMAGVVLERELEHLDVMEKALEDDLAKAEDMIDEKGNLTRDAAVQRARTVDALLKIKARRAKYLGLDKPDEVKHSVTLEDLVSGSHKGS